MKKNQILSSIKWEMQKMFNSQSRVPLKLFLLLVPRDS